MYQSPLVECTQSTCQSTTASDPDHSANTFFFLRSQNNRTPLEVAV